jgi:hypothetical protein
MRTCSGHCLQKFPKTAIAIYILFDLLLWMQLKEIAGVRFFFPDPHIANPAKLITRGSEGARPPAGIFISQKF